MLNKTIFEQLKKEHNIVKGLLRKAENCSENEREDILDQIEEQLVPHARGEEKTLYAVVLEKAKEKKTEKVVNLANEAYEEHGAVDKLMSDIKSCEVTDEKWLAKLKVIKENLEHHIKEEEEDLFPKAEKLLSDKEHETILKSYQEAKDEFEQSLPTQSQISERSPRADLSNIS